MVQFFVSPLCGNDLPYPVLVTSTMVVIFLCSGDTPMVVPRANVPAWSEYTTSVHWEDAAYEFLLYESMDGGRRSRGEVPLIMGNIEENASELRYLASRASRVVNPA